LVSGFSLLAAGYQPLNNSQWQAISLRQTRPRLSQQQAARNQQPEPLNPEPLIDTLYTGKEFL